jgi:ribose-phosphate pyrophosphokinase
MPVLCDRIREEELKNCVIVSPDAGFAKQAKRYASYLSTPVAIADKLRKAHDEKAEVLEIFGNVKGKTAIVVDDFTISGGTLADVSKKLMQREAKEVFAMVTHGVLAKGSVGRIERSPIKRLIFTDTVENQPVRFSSKIEVISVARIFGEAIKRIHNRESISAMFDGV